MACMRLKKKKHIISSDKSVLGWNNLLKEVVGSSLNGPFLCSVVLCRHFIAVLVKFCGKTCSNLPV